MEHREIEELLTPYLLGDIGPEQAEQVKSHLDTCQSCRALLQDLDMTLDLLRNALAADIPDVPQRLSPERREAVYRSRSPGWITWLDDHRRSIGFAAAAASLLALLGAMLIPLSNQSRVSFLAEVDGEDLGARVAEVEATIQDKERMVGLQDLSRSSEPARVPALKPAAADQPVVASSPAPASSLDAITVSGMVPEALAVGGDIPRRVGGQMTAGQELTAGREMVRLRSRSASEVDDSAPADQLTSLAQQTVTMDSFDDLDADSIDSFSMDVRDEARGRAQGLGLDAAGVAGGAYRYDGRGWQDTAGSTRAVEFEDAAVPNYIATASDVASKLGDVAVPESGQEVVRYYKSADRQLGEVAPEGELQQWAMRGGSVAVLEDGLVEEQSGGVSHPFGVDAYLAEGLVAEVPQQTSRPTVSKGSTALSSGLETDAERFATFHGNQPSSDAWKRDQSLQQKTKKIEDVALTFGSSSISDKNRLAEQRETNWDVNGRAFVDAKKQNEDLSLFAGIAVESPADVEEIEREVWREAEPLPALGDVPMLGKLFAAPESKVVKESTQLRPVFLGYRVNPYRVTAQESTSTFSIDVDTASYTLGRRYIDSGSRPPPDAIRTEEFVNAFDYDYRPPARRTFAIHAVGAPAPFGDGVLMKIGIKGKRLGRDDQRPSVLTFVIDTSGSMDTKDRLGLARASLHMLVGELAPTDRVAIVQVDSEARLVLEHTPVEQIDPIRAAIDGLQCAGSTHLAAGIELGYEVAAAGFVGGSINRVLILSDGAANLGSADPEEILARVGAGRKQGIVSSVFGFGLGTYNDAMLETLANRGDGAYHFIDSMDEARRVFVDDLSAALHVIARDVKIQVEFDPARVAQYRQVGYENRQLRNEDFRNDSVDAGEVGSGQSVTALYELILTEETRGRLGVVRVRYRDEQTGAIEEVSRELRGEDLQATAAEAGARFQLAASVAEFAELLRNSPFASDGDFDAVVAMVRPIAMEYHLDQRVRELLGLIQRAGELPPYSP